MAKSLKDQLQQWKAQKGELRDVEKEARRARVLAEEAKRKASEEAKAADEPPAEEERPLSDEELFRRAVEGMSSGSDAILRKYDKSDLPPSQRGVVGAAAASKDLSDQALFLQAVGEMSREDVERLKPTSASTRKPADARFARRVQKGEVEPQNVLDLHGDDRVTALKRTRVFIEAEANARTEVVLVVHGKGAGVLASEVKSLLD